MDRQCNLPHRCIWVDDLMCNILHCIRKILGKDPYISVVCKLIRCCILNLLYIPVDSLEEHQ